MRQLYAEAGPIVTALLEAEAASYHGIGTLHLLRHRQRNQMVMEVMGSCRAPLSCIRGYALCAFAR